MILRSLTGALPISIVKGVEHPPIGTLMLDAKETGTGLSTTLILLFLVIV
jgi:hypothetical protein